MGDAVRGKVEVMEHDLLALDAQLPDTAWVVGGHDEESRGCQEACPAHSPHPAVLPDSPWALPAGLPRLGQAWRPGGGSPTKPLLSPALGMAL